MLQHLAKICLLMSCACIVIGLPLDTELAKPAITNVEPAQIPDSGLDDDLDTAASHWGGGYQSWHRPSYYGGWNRPSYYGGGWGHRGYGGWGGRGYGGWGRNYGGYGRGWGGYGGGYW